MTVKFQGIEEESQDIKGNSLPEQMPKNVKPAPQRSVSEIENLIKKLKVSEEVISEAEGAVHGRNVTEIHFCSLGRMDAIADILTKVSKESPTSIGGGGIASPLLTNAKKYSILNLEFWRE